MLGKRENNIYGNISFEDYFLSLKSRFADFELDYYQSNVEGELINQLQKADGIFEGIILNAGGYTHTSVAISDAVKAIETPVVEVHISNIFAREEFRHISLIAANAKGSIIGFGLKSYDLALQSFRKTVLVPGR